MKRILVTGGTGYIGSHTVYELIDNGYDVVVADNLETGFRKAVHPKARFYQGDIRSKEFCDHVFSSEKIDAVIHFAANSLSGESSGMKSAAKAVRLPMLFAPTICPAGTSMTPRSTLPAIMSSLSISSSICR